MVLLECKAGYFGKDGKIYCHERDGLPCAFQKMCTVTMKWHQTASAGRCNLNKGAKK